MNETREFLSKVLPWEKAGPDVYFNLHWGQKRDDGKGKWWNGRAYDDLDDFVRGVRTWTKPDMDLYVCMSSQSRCEIVDAKTGKPYKKSVRFQHNVVGIKSFYVDVDVKEKAYKTTQEALDVFRLFIDALDMPMPTIVVSSGSGGFHAHWVVERVLTLDEWQPLAYALAHATQQFGLICDTQCTIDSARILRIPGTFNYKTTPPNKVSLMSSGDICSFDDISEVLAPYVGITPVGNPSFQAFPFERRQPTLDGDELGAGIVVYEANKVTLTAIADVCGFIDDVWRDGGSECDNPKWYMSLQVAAHVEEGREAAHLLSYRHETYTPEETDAQFDRIEREHKERDIGWPSCQKIQLSGSTQCAGCKFLHLNKSPFNFAVIEPPPLALLANIAPGTPSTDIWPKDYYRASDGLIYLNVTDAESGHISPQKTCPYPISNGWLQDNPWVLHFTCKTALTKETKVEVPLADFGAMGGTRKVLSQHGIVLSDGDFKRTQEFLLAWTQKLQQQKDSVVSSTPFGWSLFPDGSVEGFTYAGRVWGAGTDRPAAQDDAELYSIFSPHGSAQPWIDAAKVITDQDRPALNAVLAASFAAPLVKFTGHDGLLVSAYSGKTGIGKSSVSLVGAGVWGHSTKGRQGLSDTQNSVFGRMGKLKALPIFWDELQGADQQGAAAKMIFQLSGGMEKSRMNADLSLRKRGTWQTLMVMVSNYSMVEPILLANKSHNAGLMRLFEFEVPLPTTDKGRIEVSKATRTIAKLTDNYGHAGLIYAQFLGANAGRIDKEMEAALKADEIELKAGEGERYWSAAVTLLTVAARYVNELGLARIDVGELKKFLVETFYDMRATAKDSPADMGNSTSISTLLAQFLNAMRQRNTLVTNRMHIGQGKPVKGSITILSDLTKLDAIYVHVGKDDKLMRISSTYLSEWLAKHERPRHAFIRGLEEEFGFKKTNGILGGGTSVTTGAKEYLYEINTDNPKLQGFFSLE